MTESDPPDFERYEGTESGPDPAFGEPDEGLEVPTEDEDVSQEEAEDDTPLPSEPDDPPEDDGDDREVTLP